jgi:hypothetical protein
MFFKNFSNPDGAIAEIASRRLQEKLSTCNAAAAPEAPKGR